MTAIQSQVETYAAYRARLQTLVQIPIEATDQAIHEMIAARFPAQVLVTLFDTGSLSREACQIIMSTQTLKLRARSRERLSVSESDRLYRVASITALAEAVFGNREKASRWLNAPKKRFLGSSPVGMLSTAMGTWLVEQTLVQATEGFVL